MTFSCMESDKVEVIKSKKEKMRAEEKGKESTGDQKAKSGVEIQRVETL